MLDHILLGILLVLIGLVVLGIVVALKGITARTGPNYVNTDPSGKLNDHPKYGPRRRASINAGKADQQGRWEREEYEIREHHLGQIPRWARKRDTPRAEARREHHWQLADREINQARIRRTSKRAQRHSPRVHPKTGETHGGIRREPYPKREHKSRNWRNKKDEK